MEIHLLYDSRPQPDKLPLVLDELERQNMRLHQLWEPVAAKTVVESINLSFKQIIADAKRRGVKEVCIIEDDLMFACEGAWDYFMANKPEVFDIWIGGNYLRNNPDEYKAPRVKVDAYVGNQLIVVSDRYYDTFLSVPDMAHVDMAQEGLGEFYACWPMAALQRPGYSSNVGVMVNYNSDLKPEWIYNGAVHNI